MEKYFLPLLTFFVFIVESTVMQVFSPERFGAEAMLVPHFVVVVIFLMTAFLGRKRGLLYALVFGFLLDFIHTGIIGINIFLLLVLTYLIAFIFRFLQPNLLTVFIGTIIGLGLLEIGLYYFYHFLGFITISFPVFLKIRLFPTLILNSCFLIIIYFPMSRYLYRLFKQLKIEDER
ncbi:rod shape-determining protein MreD [Massilibacterium senegalense]|uniref:rod shape-determining protein MreD n=1 Tax=Massilibacterium senegalense TaxID=1632858 RepID=UPI000783D6F1|nr:rod shape-determining protein MreD [Massilibacterium senegalense]